MNTGHSLHFNGKRNDWPTESGLKIARCGLSGDYFHAYYDHEEVVWKNTAGDIITFGNAGREHVNDRWYDLDMLPDGASLMEQTVKPLKLTKKEILKLASKEPTTCEYDWTEDNVLSFAKAIEDAVAAKYTGK